MPDEPQVAAARRAAVHPWMVPLARFGYVAKGLVFLTLGLYTAEVALGQARSPEDIQGALVDLASEPVGRVLVAGMSLGLFGYTLWLLVRGLFDADQQGRTPLALLRRAACVLSGLAYAGLGWFAAGVVLGGQGDHTEQTTRFWTALLLTSPVGRWLVILAGVGALVVGVNHLVVAGTGMFLQYMDTRGSRRQTLRAVRRLGQLGIVARGTMFLTIGVLLVRAGWFRDAWTAGGIQKALMVLGRPPFGMLILGVMALGLIALGLYSLLQTRYRLIRE